MHEVVFELEEFVVKGIGGGLMECSFNTEKSQLLTIFSVEWLFTTTSSGSRKHEKWQCTSQVFKHMSIANIDE